VRVVGADAAADAAADASATPPLAAGPLPSVAYVSRRRRRRCCRRRRCHRTHAEPAWPPSRRRGGGARRGAPHLGGRVVGAGCDGGWNLENKAQSHHR
jgi:hypothetical protein